MVEMSREDPVRLPELPLVASTTSHDDAAEDLEGIQSILGVEECVRYYPPDLSPVTHSAAIFTPTDSTPSLREIDVFVDVPYCGTICGFCPFNVYSYGQSEIKSYLDALERELDIIAGLHDLTSTRPRTIWIGGGTPSVLDEASLERMFRVLARHFEVSSATEVTFEIKPVLNDLTQAKFDLMKEFGVSRISMGVQSTHPHQLRILGRGHTAEDAYAVIDLAKQQGFAVNIDMIYRLPGESLTEVEADLDAVRWRNIDHLSFFPYVAHEGTSLARRIGMGRVAKPGTRSEFFAMFCAGRDRLAEAGYVGYTPYHFGLDGKRCQYHVDRWGMPQLETLGLGPGAFSFFNGHIYANQHSPERYATMTAAGQAPVQQAKRLSETERVTRLAVLGVKLLSIDTEEFRRTSGVAMGEYYRTELDLLQRAGLIEVNDGKLTCTVSGIAFNNDIATILSTDTAARTKHPQAVDLMRLDPSMTAT